LGKSFLSSPETGGSDRGNRAKKKKTKLEKKKTGMGERGRGPREKEPVKERHGRV